MFKSKNNPFLAQMLNSKNIQEVTYVLNTPSGKKVLITNIEAIEHFLMYAKKNQQQSIQNILAKSKYSVKEINLFARNYAENFIIKSK